MTTSSRSLDGEFTIKGLVIVILWSTPPLVSRLWVGTGVFPPFYFGFLRYVLGSATLLLLIILQKKLHILVDLLTQYSRVIIFCALWLVLMILGQNYSIKFILGSSSSVLLNFNPTIIYIIAPLLFVDEVYSKEKTLGVIISSIGIGFVFFATVETGQDFSPTTFFLGNSLGFLSGLAWAGYSISLKKFFQENFPLEVTTLNLLVASGFLLVISLFTESIPHFEDFTVLNVWGLVVIGVGAAAIAFTLYLSLIYKYGAIRAGNIQFLIPLLSLLLAWIFLNEFSIFALGGGILCALGVAIVNYGKSDNQNS